MYETPFAKNPVDVFHISTNRIIFARKDDLNHIQRYYESLDEKSSRKRFFTPIRAYAAVGLAGYHFCRFVPKRLPDKLHPDASLIICVEVPEIALLGRNSIWDICPVLAEYYKDLIDQFMVAEFFHYDPKEGLRYRSLYGAPIYRVLDTING